MSQVHTIKKIIQAILITASVYHLLWGILSLSAPSMVLHAMDPDNLFHEIDLIILAMISIGLGMGYLISAFDPFRKWIVVFSAFIIYSLITTAFFIALFRNQIPITYWQVVTINWMMWLPPFAFILYQVYLRSFDTDQLMIETFQNDEMYPLELFDTYSGKNLEEMSNESPVLLVFLRHFGCPFCKETLNEISRLRSSIEARGVTITIVYMVSHEEAEEPLESYDLSDIERISDPESILYKKFGLRRGSFSELFGTKVLRRGLMLRLKKGLQLTREMGDSFQMPGVFLLQKGKIQKSYIHRSAADSPDYMKILD